MLNMFSEKGTAPVDPEITDLAHIPEDDQSSEIPSTFAVKSKVHGCLQVLGAFFIFFNVWGLNLAFGTFQSFYALSYIPTSTSSDIAWIGTVQSWLLIVGGLLSGPLFDLGYNQSMIIIGSILGVMGMMMLSLAHEYYAMFLSQGVCVGLGFGLLYVPAMALVSRSFTTRRAVALGVSSSGAPVGGIVYTIMFNQLISKVGFPWTVRLIAFLMLALFIAAALMLLVPDRHSVKVKPTQRRSLIDLRAFKDLPFWSFAIGNFFLYLGYITPFYYIPTYAETKLGTSRSMASNVLMISQASSVIGRVVLTLFAHYFGSMIAWIVCGVLSGVLCICWISADTLVRFILFAAFYGCISGALIPLPPSVFTHVCPDPKSLGTWLGMAQSLSSFASLLGPPIAGALASIGSDGSEDLNYLGPLVPFTPALLPTSQQIQGRTILLEKLAPKHADDLFALTGGLEPPREALWDYMFDGPYSNTETFKASIASKSTSTDPYFYAIIDKRNSLPTFGKAIGYLSLMRMTPDHLGIEIGNVMYSAALQRTTAATEAIYLLAQHSFHNLGYRRLEWKCHSLNEPSRRAALRLGFSFEGVFRQHMIVKGRNRDTAWYSILRDEWDASLKTAMEKWLDVGNFGEDGGQIKSLQDLRAELA
ncbi:Major facilitator superfamily domain general substrate transporter [Penicillium concentricum]|uniref:Major facilitator superfamily domain general substrate transporter n=1 Tax=Penicillium concentricum TaxID=293559 RepID=A0A9W9VAP4_9EURO|nr:Major facilitator superfamily domain general substrate transporter [Penicillium concentricum]KAJ5373779.1 Major facilitator superfamily domain general substrate transporter [Penicillium concentricum]